MSEKRWYSPGEIARVLGVTRRTVTRWIREGKLQAEHPHGYKRYSKVTPEQLDEAARNGRIPALAAGWLTNRRT